MKRMVKPKVFLISMAVVASLPASAYAQGGDKVERYTYQYSSGGRGAAISDPIDVIEEAPEMRIDRGVGISSRLLGKLKGMAESLSSRVEAISAIDQDKEWKLGLSQAETAKLVSSDNPRLTESKPVGVALRLKF